MADGLPELESMDVLMVTADDGSLDELRVENCWPTHMAASLDVLKTWKGFMVSPEELGYDPLPQNEQDHHLGIVRYLWPSDTPKPELPATIWRRPS